MDQVYQGSAVRIRRWRTRLPLLLFATIVAGAACEALAAPAAKSHVWIGPSGSFVWRFTNTDLSVTAYGGKRPIYSAAKGAREHFQPEGFSSYQVRARPLSLVGSFLSYRRDDYWDGGAHPSGGISYVVVDAVAPKKPVRLTDLFPDDQVLAALLADPIVQHLVIREKIDPPRNTRDLIAALKEKEFGGDSDSLYSIPETLLQQFAFHHVEGDRVAVRLCAPWGTEANRFHSTEIGLVLPIPPLLREPLTDAAARREGFLMPAAPKLFPDEGASLFEWKRPGTDH